MGRSKRAPGIDAVVAAVRRTPQISHPGPRSMLAAIERRDWKAVRAAIYRREASWGRYGREAMAVMAAIPIDCDRDLVACRAQSAYFRDDWEDFARCLAALEREGDPSIEDFRALRTLVFRQAGQQPSSAPVTFRDDLRQDAMFGPLRRLGFYYDGPADVSHKERASFNLLQDALWFGVNEAVAGRLPVAEAILASADGLGAPDDWYHAVRIDTIDLIRLARGQRSRGTHALLDRLLTDDGPPASAIADHLLVVAHLVALRGPDAAADHARLALALARDRGSPCLLLQAQAWSEAAAFLTGEPDRGALAGLLLRIPAHKPGLRALPEIVLALATDDAQRMRRALREARRAGNVALMIAALTSLAALAPERSLLARWVHLLDLTGWARPVLVPESHVVGAIRTATRAGVRSGRLLKLAAGTGHPSIVRETAAACLEPCVPGELRLEAVHALASLGEEQDRQLLRAFSRELSPVGRAAAAVLRNPPARMMLTAREEQVLALAAPGLTNREIASRLGLSPHTVARHFDSIRVKLGAANRTEAVFRHRSRAPEESAL